MIAPAAHPSKGLAKAFVSSAGGKGPELFIPPIYSGPLIVPPEAQGCPLRVSWAPLELTGLRLSPSAFLLFVHCDTDLYSSGT